MFSLVPNASKLALIYLAQTFQELGGTLIDCQFETPHLKSMGGRYIDYEEYMRYVQETFRVSVNVSFFTNFDYQIISLK